MASGCKPSTQNVPATPASLQNDSPLTDETQPIPTIFILNPDTSRPQGYPDRISVASAEGFVVGKEILGQGCGGMVWEGNGCGMYDNSYGVKNSPWFEEPVPISYTYAQTKTGTFLAGLTFGDNTYRRPDRNSDFLIWDRNIEPERQFEHAYRILMGGDSVDRKLLLTKLKKSLVGVDVNRFSRQKRIALQSLLKNCVTDEDIEVVSMASSIRILLGGEPK